MMSTHAYLIGRRGELAQRHRWMSIRRRWCSGAALSMCIATAGVAMAGGSAGAAGKSLQKVTFATTSAGLGSIILHIGVHHGFFAHQGLTVTVSSLNTTLAIQAVEAGKLDYDEGAGVTADTAALNGQPVKTYAAVTQRETFVLASAPNVTSLSQLKGTTVASEHATALNTVYLTRLLTMDGLTSSVDVAEVVNNSSAAIAYMEAGKASAAVITYGAFLQLPAGYHILYNFFTPKSPFYALGNGVTANTTYAASHKGQLRKLIRGMVNAANYFEKHEKGVLPTLESSLKLTAAKAKTFWKAVHNAAFSKNGKPTPKAIKFQASLDQATLKLTKPPPASKLYTWKYVPK